MQAVLGLWSRVTEGGNVPAGLFEQYDTASNPRCVTLKNAVANYALKIDHTPPTSYDAVNIFCGPGMLAGTALGIVASNTSLSTVKVTNDASQVSGAVIGAVGLHVSRTAPIFAAQNYSGNGAIGYAHTCCNDAACGFVSKSFSSGQLGDHFQARTFDGRPTWRVKGNGAIQIAPEGADGGLVLECIVGGKTIFSVDEAGNVSAAGRIKGR